MPKLILINGPPRSGKSTAAGYFTSIRNHVRYKMTSPMDGAIKCLYGLTDVEFARLREQDKDVPSSLLFGKTMREVLIDLSENYIKLRHGSDFFGQVACRYLSNANYFPCDIVVDDSGFKEEIEPLIEFFGPSEVKLIRLFKKGCSFEGDSRSYIRTAAPTTMYSVDNDGSLADLAKKLERVIA